MKTLLFKGIIKNMIINVLMKKPVLFTGIILFSLFIYNLHKSGKLKSDKFHTISCRAVVVMLKKRIPANWSYECSNHNLYLLIVKKDPLSRANIYREIANSLKFVALNSPQDALERTPHIILKLKTPNLSVESYTKGKDIVKLSTLKSPQMIAEHLKHTVKVKEFVKK